jgi:tRNA(adenine34) deaminase
MNLMSEWTPELVSSWMGFALDEASEAATQGEVPVGAVVVRGREVVARGRNRTEELRSPVAHAELIALEAASARLGDWRLPGCVLVVTVEPCTMCAGALLLARVEGIVFGTPEPRTGALGSLYDVSLAVDESTRPRVVGGVRERESRELIQSFFEGIRGD